MNEADYFQLNRRAWDRRAKAHLASTFYDVKGFLAGATSLREIELRELNEVSGRKLLHLQCHFGLDTLSWARMGARCTGVDLSPVSIEQAETLNRQAGLDAQFVCCDVYGFQSQAGVPFDIVFTSYGAICWLPDLDRWAEVVSANLAPGGRFYMVEFHPIYDLIAGYSYFPVGRPDIEREASYTENGSEVVDEIATWVHSMSSVVNALIKAGIRIESLNEYPWSPYDCFDGLVEREPGRFFLEHNGHEVPMVYSISGTKQT